MSIPAWIVLGLIVGFIANKLFNKTGEGVLMNIVFGIIGSRRRRPGSRRVSNPKEDRMISLRNVAISVFGVALSMPPVHSQDLSRYRDFQLGTNLPAVAKQMRVKPSEARAIHERPAMIQELEWQSPFTKSSQRVESVGNILFRFYNGELYHIVVTYDRERTEGMTAEDLVEAVWRSTEPPPGLTPKSSSLRPISLPTAKR